MYDLGIARAGRVSVPLSKNIYQELLPKQWREIGPAGVRIAGIVYTRDDDLLADLVGKKSEYRGEHAGRWPFGVDSRDLSKAWFHHPEHERWYALHRRGSGMPDLPFNDVMLVQAKAILKARNGSPKNDLELSCELDKMIELLRSEQSKGRDRRKAINARHDMSESARDLERLGPTEPRDLPDQLELDEVSESLELEIMPTQVATVDRDDDPEFAELLDPAFMATHLLYGGGHDPNKST